MGKRLGIGVILILVVGVAAFAWYVFAGQSLTYQGRTLTQWFGEKSEPDHGSYEALREIGTNAYPLLLGMLRMEDLPGVLPLVSLAQRLPLVPVHYIPADVRHQQAVYGIAALGEHSKELVPGLIQLYELNRSESSQCAVAMALAGIGPEAQQALPSLLRGLGNTNELVLAHTIYAILRVNMSCPRPELVVPALTNFLHHPSALVRTKAAEAVGFFGPGATDAVSQLLPLLFDTDGGVRAYAAQAIRRIDPQNAALAGLD